MISNLLWCSGGGGGGDDDDDDDLKMEIMMKLMIHTRYRHQGLKGTAGAKRDTFI